MGPILSASTALLPLLCAAIAMIVWLGALAALRSARGHSRVSSFDFWGGAVLSLVVGAALFWTSPLNGSALDIVPDSVEYCVGAWNYVTTGSYGIVLQGNAYPPRYPPWFSVGVLAPVLHWFGADLGNCIYPGDILAVLGAVAAYLIGVQLSGVGAGIGAALLLCAVPGLRYFEAHVLVDGPIAVISLVCLLGCLTLRRFESFALRLLLLLCLGICVGAAAAFRMTGIFLVLPALWALRPLRGPLHRTIGLVAIGAPPAALLLLTAYYNAEVFGAPGRTGYHYWTPASYELIESTFGARFVPSNLQRYLLDGGILGLAGLAMILQLAWLQSLKKPGVSIIDAGAVKSTLVFAALSSAPLLVFFLLYFYTTLRFILPISSLAAVLGGSGLGAMLPRYFGSPRWWRAGLAIVALGAGGLMFAGGRSPVPPRRAAAELLASRTERDAVIVSGIDEAYLYPFALFGSQRTYIPLSRNVEYASKLIAPHPLDRIMLETSSDLAPRSDALKKAGAVEVYPSVASEDPSRLHDLLSAGRRVYLDASFATEDDLRKLAGYVRCEGVESKLFRLVLDGGEPCDATPATRGASSQPRPAS